VSAAQPVAGKMAEKTFLNRWSSTKLAGDNKDDKGDKIDVSERIDQVPDQSAMLPVDPETENETPEEQLPPDLPAIESLDKDSDYTPFLAENVPEELAQKAFRKLWRSDPEFAVLDGLNDYDEDYSALGIVEMVVETAYKVGKGLVTEDETDGPDETAEAEPEANEAPVEEDSEDLPDEQSVELAENSEKPVPHGEKH
jgi:hypothetical protein